MMEIKDNHLHVVAGESSLAVVNDLIHRDYEKVSKFILVDSNTFNHCFPLIVNHVPALKEAEILEVDSGEDSKSMEVVTQLCQALLDLGADRKSLLVNLGGGVITDLGGFVASVFKRGIDFINIPTSLLAQVDASVGGKVGVDLGEFKNQIGVFNHAKLVAIDSQFLKTLPNEQISSGFAEMFKHALIESKSHWDSLLNTSSITDAHIFESVQIKYDIVKRDFKEDGDRKKLNFGHTVGHALEGMLLKKGVDILHGHAVAAGMVCEAYISHKLGGISKDELELVVKELTHRYAKIIFEEKEFEGLIQLMMTDKKNVDGKINFTILKGIGKSEINYTANDDLIIESLKFYKSAYSK